MCLIGTQVIKKLLIKMESPKNQFQNPFESAFNCKYTLFYEARSHCRHKSILDLFLKTIDVESFKNNSFEEIFLKIQKIKNEMCIKGSIGNLTIYDIASDITRYHGKYIDKVYIIGSGPVRAIKLLGIKKQSDSTLKLHYISCMDVCTKFSLPPTCDGDLLETFLCQWQKNIF